jgi:ATP-binding cassette, subfamily B, bacterial
VSPSLTAHLVAARDARDSGAACLATVLTALGRPTSLHEVRNRCGGAARTSVATITQVGRTFGLEMVALQAAEENLPDVPVPAIVLRGDRFVLLEGHRLGRYVVLDPTSGWRSRVRAAQLVIDPEHTVLTVAPGPQFFREHHDAPDRGWRVLLRQAARTDGFAPLLAGMIALSLLTMAVGLTGPALTAVLVDEVLPGRLPGVLGPVAIGLVLLTATTFIAALLRGRLTALVAGRLDNRLMTALFAHMMALPYRFFRERPTGDLVQRFSSNTAIRNAVTGQTVNGLLAAVQVVVYAGALMLISPTFAVYALAIGAVEVLVLVLPARRLARLSRRELEQVADTQGFTVEVANGAAYLKASGREAGMLSSWALRLHLQLDASMRRQRFAAAVSATSTTTAATASSILLLVAVAQVLSGALTLGVALALLALAGSFLMPLAQLVSALQSLQAVQGHVQRISAVLEEPVDQAEKHTPPLPPVVGHVELCDVSFRYDEDGPWAVEGISIDIPAGSRVAIVGGSGSGKSTLSGVLLGLHPPDEGRVLIDGLDLHAHDLGSFRRQCGVVLQEPVVFQGTVRENVAFGDDEVSEEDVRAAVRAACLDEEVARMSHGIDTVIGERGGTLSGGQRQRLALARALVGRPALIVLDEATSALDNLTESAITAGLRANRTTTVVIAHRLSTVQDADHIVVLDGGRVVQRGTHDELYAVDGVYRRLVATGSVALAADQSDDAEEVPVGRTR